MTRMQLADHDKDEMDHSDFAKLLREIKESEIKSFGTLVNSFYELEPEYADHYRKVLGKRAWQIGPVCLYNREIADKANRGWGEASIDECFQWLDSKKPNSVIYVSFGSIAEFTPSQLHEIAMGLEASGHQFIWVVRKCNSGKKYWLPGAEGFEERTKDRGLIIRGWAPQVLILGHEAVGGFITHCGWNSTLEGICAGLPMVTWPVMAEQFLNELLVTEILKTGVRSGARKCGITTAGSEEVKREAIAGAVEKVMKGEEAEEMRGRARKLKEMATKAIEEGGSSYKDLNSVLEELIHYPYALKQKTQA